MENQETEATTSNEVEAPKDKLFKKPKVKLYSKHRDEDDAETEAFARGDLAKFNREQKEKAETATVQKDTETSEEIASSDDEATPSTERPENAEERVFKKRYDDLNCLLYTSPSPRDATLSRMPSSA